MYFNKTHLGHPGMTSCGEMSKWSRTLPRPSFSTRHPRGLSCYVSFCFNSLFAGASCRILSSRAMTSPSSPRIQASEKADDSSLFDTAPRSLLLNPFRCARIQHRGIQRRTKPGAKKKKKRTESLTPPSPLVPSRTDAPVYHFIPKRLCTLKQTVETVIVRAQLSCTVHLLDC